MAKLSGSQKIMYTVFTLCLLVILVFGVLCIAFSHLVEGVIIFLSSLLIGVCISEAIKIDKGKTEIKKKEKKKKKVEENLGTSFFKANGVVCESDGMQATVDVLGYNSAFTIQNIEGGDKVVFKWRDIVSYDRVDDECVSIEHNENGVFGFEFPTNVKATVFMQYCEKFID